MPTSSIMVVSKCTVHPTHQNKTKSTPNTLKLSVSDLPMLSCHYIQKGILLPPPSLSIQENLIARLKHSLSIALAHFPALAGRLTTDDNQHIHILCNGAGVEFIHAKANHIKIDDILLPIDVPDLVKGFFAIDRTLSYCGHFKPLLAVQVTELADGVFIGITCNHAVTDGTSFWHFFNVFSQICKEGKKIIKSPDFCRHNVLNSPAVLTLPEGGPKVTFSDSDPIRERIFHFSRESILMLKSRANNSVYKMPDPVESLGKQSNDGWKNVNNRDHGNLNGNGKATEISSFQSLSAQLWRSVTRGRNLPPSKITTFRMAVNCRHRLEPCLEPYYFGNAIQSIPTAAPSGELLSKDLSWSAGLLHCNVVAHNDATVRRGIDDWENNPRVFPLGNFDGAMITMGSSPRFPMYDNDFGWGRPLVILSGRANKFDGKISAFPGREGSGTVDLEVDVAHLVKTDEELAQHGFTPAVAQCGLSIITRTNDSY